MTKLRDFTAVTIAGRQAPLSDYEGKVILVVNTASNCGFTPQYKGLQWLHDTYSARGFAVLGFPCNQFRGQEPGSASDIQDFCTREYAVTFPMFEKVEVNGAGAHPLYVWLKAKAPGLLGSKAIKWNFTKFLVDRAGEPTVRYAPTMDPVNIAPTIERLLRP